MTQEVEWNENLYGCTDDCKICLCGCCCTPCLFGKNAEKISDKNCVVMSLAYWILSYCYLCWIPHCYQREKLRERYHLKEEPCGDWPVACFCGPCALCQEARELKSRKRQQPVSFVPNPGVAVVSQPQSDVKREEPVSQRV